MKAHFYKLRFVSLKILGYSLILVKNPGYWERNKLAVGCTVRLAQAGAKEHTRLTINQGVMPSQTNFGWFVI